MHSFWMKVASAGGPLRSFAGWPAARQWLARVLLANDLASSAPGFFVDTVNHSVCCYVGNVNDEDVGKKKQRGCFCSIGRQRLSLWTQDRQSATKKIKKKLVSKRLNYIRLELYLINNMVPLPHN